LLGRYGGEEFAVILPDSAQDPAEVAERLRAAVSGAPVRTPEAEIAVTVSVGVAGLQGDPDLSALLSRADRALYAAKRAGRNRVVTG
jgi:diguanylate cyclase (GGDEF)-like protein